MEFIMNKSDAGVMSCEADVKQKAFVSQDHSPQGRTLVFAF